MQEKYFKCEECQKLREQKNMRRIRITEDIIIEICVTCMIKTIRLTVK